jgi:hypothetical protein
MECPWVPGTGGGSGGDGGAQQELRRPSRVGSQPQQEPSHQRQPQQPAGADAPPQQPPPAPALDLLSMLAASELATSPTATAAPEPTAAPRAGEDRCVHVRS